MNRIPFALFAALLATTPILTQSTSSYVVRTFAGQFPLGDGGPATSALLYFPSAALPDGNGNLYIADTNNGRIRKVATNGTISTFAQGVFANRLALGRDGDVYAAVFGAVYRYSPAGDRTTVVGTGLSGFTGDGGPATAAQVGSVSGVFLDAQGNLFLTDGNRIRRVGADGIIRTIAGNGTAGFSGDGGQAVNALISAPRDVVADRAGNVYFPDASNRRIRKISAAGVITTVAGNGTFGRPVEGPAAGSPLGFPASVTLDDRDNLSFVDQSFPAVLRIAADGNLQRVAGTFSTTGSSLDGAALSTVLRGPSHIIYDAAGSLYLAESSGHRVRRLGPDGILTTVAGRAHYGGDGGPALQALFNQPTDLELDAANGRVLIADAFNYRLRPVSALGQISTVLGTGNDGFTPDGAVTAASSINYVSGLTIARDGGILFTEGSRLRRFANLSLTTVAGTGAFGNTGDGGSAIAAQLGSVGSPTLDSAGNIYVADSNFNRIRRISPDGAITAFAGNGTRGYSGDGGLATAAMIGFFAAPAMATDAAGNLYFCDTPSYRVRRVTPGGIISTVVGNGAFGAPADAAQALSSPFSQCGGIAFDAAGDMYLSSQNYQHIYKVSQGVIRRISGAGNLPVTEGAIAGLTTGFFGGRLRIDASGDIYAADSSGGLIRKLTLNTPGSLLITDGNEQTGAPGATLDRPLRVQLLGRAGAGIPGATITFAVASGTATLSTTTTETDSTGTAGIGVTLGSTPGPVVITATAVGTTLPVLRFTLTIRAGGTGACALSAPVISSVRSLSDFGGLATFASGSWLEMKGTNLAANTRTWSGEDFQGANAPVSLDGTRVSIGGRPAFVYYISPGQVNVQAPEDDRLGPLPVIATNCAGASAPLMVGKSLLAPGLLAPQSFLVGGRQYLVALHRDGSTFVGNPGLIAGVAFAPGKPGDSLVAYGVGFGGVMPAVPAGEVVSQATSIPNLSIRVGARVAAITFAGLAPGNIGLYQFNFIVPDIEDGDQQIRFAVGEEPVPQVVFLTIRR